MSEKPFILGREIVSETLRSGDITPYLSAGLTPEFMSDAMHPAYAAVFTGQDYDAWAHILRHHEAHGRVPDVRLFRRSFPEQSYALPAARTTASELTSLARDAINQFETEIGATEAGRYIDAGDPVMAAKIMLETAEKVLSQPAALPFRLLSLADIDNLPDPEILIDGLIDHGTVTKLVGESGKGKSFVAIDWSLCIATGRKWQGREVRKGRVLYVAAEGAFGLKKRIRAWKRTNGDVPEDSFKLIPDAVQLADAGQLQALVRVAKDFDVVVIDTLARTSAGLEENSATDMGVYINNCYKIRDSAREAGATVLIVHHTGYDKKRARGSSALFANGDGEILIESDDPHDLMTMTVKKRKDGEAGQQLCMHLETVDCGDWTSCVVREQDAPEIELSPRERVLAALTSAWQPTKDVERLTGLTNSTADRALKALVAEELAESHRAGNRTEYRLV